MLKLTEYAKREKSLFDKSFTDEFKNGTLPLDTVFDSLDLEVEVTSIYDDGGIMGIALDLTERNTELLKSIVKDFEAYNDLIDLQFHSEKQENQTDLVSILDYSEKKLGERILFDWENKVFYYEGAE